MGRHDADCLFRVYPMHRYNAQNQWKNSRSASSNFSDVVMLKKLQHAAELEKKMNEEEEKRLFGTVVAYGQCIQVRDRACAHIARWGE